MLRPTVDIEELQSERIEKRQRAFVGVDQIGKAENVDQDKRPSEKDTEAQRDQKVAFMASSGMIPHADAQ
jgi:hypothetical protein